MKKTLILLLLALATTVAAGPFAKPSEPSGKLVLDQPHPTKQLFAMRVLEIDGENINGRSQAMWLKPGEYEITFSAHIDNRLTKGQMGTRIRRGDDFDNTMTIKVEAGKTYFLALDASDRDRKNWSGVVYKTL